jgi:hypothetical protein
MVPYFSFQLELPLPPEAIAERLRAITVPPKRFWARFPVDLEGPDERFTFVGTIESGRFKLQRVIGGRNSFLPQIRGRIENLGGMTQIKVRMFLHPLVCVFMALWFGSLGWGIAVDGNAGLSSIPAIGMFLFGVGLLFVGFFPEARRARELITSVVLGDNSKTGPV